MKEQSNSHEENLQKADRVAYLIAGHLNDTLTDIERDELDDWITASDENLALFEKLTDEDNIEAGLHAYHVSEKIKQQALQYTKEKAGIHQKKSLIKMWWPYVAAASVIVAVVGLVVFNNNKTIEKEKTASTPKGVFIPAGSDKAVLMLSDGRTIILDSGGSGVLANEGTVSIEKNNNGELIYKGTATAMSYNVVSTPRGGQFKLTLGDGSRVWLNAESSLKFPAGFATAERTVELRGECFFEVAEDKDRPFSVKVFTSSGDSSLVKVLGTAFNVNGYNDEGVVKTTLIEGSVKISKGTDSKIIKPGEQALVGDGIKIIKADVAEEIAWKEGKFLFRDASVISIGEQIKRWYDVAVEYEGKNSQLFNLEANRNVPLPELLKSLAGTGQLNFELKERKLIIKP